MIRSRPSSLIESARRVLRAGAVLALLLCATAALAERPRVYGIEGAQLVPAPGRQIDNGTIVIRDGLIEAVGRDAAIPPDAVTIDGSGLWVYPGLIDPDTMLGQQSAGGGGGRSGASSGDPSRSTPPGAVHPVAKVRPETRARDSLVPFDEERKREAERYRNLGFAAVLTRPDSGIFRGSSAAILLLDDTAVPEMILRDDVAQHVGFESGRFGQGYPNSLMGVAAAFRQALLDAKRHAEWTARYGRRPTGMPRPERVAAYEALAPLVAGRMPAVFHSESPADALLAGRLADEFDIDAIISGSGHEWEIAGRLAADGRTLILPVAFPDKPKVEDEDEALDVDLRTMRRYLNAPSAASRLDRAGVRFALTTRGLKSLTDFSKNLRKIVDAGLPEDAALAALTTVPAGLLGIDRITGTLEPGKIANVAVFDGPIFAEETKLERIFVDGVEYKAKEKKQPEGGDPNAVVDPRGEWSVVFEFGSRTMERSWTIEGKRDDYSGSAETQSGTVSFDDVKLVGNMLTVIFPARGGRGAFELTVVITGNAFEGSAEMGPRTVPVKGTRVGGPEGGGR